MVCIVCPVIELFDYWDHTLQTGNDTEYTFVVLALCVGFAFSMPGVYVRAARYWSAVASRLLPVVSSFSERLQVTPFSTPAVSPGPQVVVLRI